MRRASQPVHQNAHIKYFFDKMHDMFRVSNFLVQLV